MNTSLANSFFVFGLLLMGGYVLYIGQAILIPFVIAVFFWYLMRALGHKIKAWTRLPGGISKALSILIVLLLVAGFVQLTKGNIEQFVNEAPNYQANINKFIASTMEQFMPYIGDFDRQSVQELVAKVNFGAIAAGIVTALGSVTAMVVTILLYLVFLFLEEKTFEWKLRAFIHDKRQRDHAEKTLRDIGRSFESYIGLKTLASLGMGVAGYAVLVYFGVNNAVFWALIFGVLNFIPYVGPVIGVALPFLAAVVQFGDIQDPVIVAVLLSLIAFIVGNIIEPKIFGNSLNLSPIVFMIALSVWGSLWGIIGMILCIPIMVGIIIALSGFEKTRKYALLMTEREL